MYNETYFIEDEMEARAILKELIASSTKDGEWMEAEGIKILFDDGTVEQVEDYLRKNFA